MGLTSTSYAVLGLLAVRPWSSYELTKQMTRSLGRFWPRAESKLYEEPKKLVELGLATMAREQVGARTRLVYSITDEGRVALSGWLQQPAAPPQLESEAMLRVFLADAGTTADLRRSISGLRDWAEQRLNEDAVIAAEYLSGQGEFDRRLAVLTLVGRFSWQSADAVREWADWALATIETWPERPGEARPDRASLIQIAGSQAPPD